MAKVGEGDPRWIVQKREDGANVNAWHWVEKDITAWTHELIKNEIKKLILISKEENPNLYINVSSVEISGEASANIRKARMVYIYDLSLTIFWKGKVYDSEGNSKNCSGKISFPDISFDFEKEDPDFQIRIENCPGDVENRVRQELKEKAVLTCVQCLRKCMDEMKKVHNYVGQKPNDNENKTTKIANLVSPSCAHAVRVTPAAKEREKEKKEEESLYGEIRITQQFRADPPMLYNLLMDGNSLSRLTQSQCTLVPEKGKPFTMFSGAVSGEIVDLEINKKIVQTWRFSSWPSNHYSKVEIILTQHKDGTKLDLIQKEIPKSDVSRTKEGWNVNFWSRIKSMFGVPSCYL